MDFLTFKNYLIENDIILFDCFYRIAYNNVFNLNDFLAIEKTGGGHNTNNIYFLSPFSIIKNKNKKRVKLFIDNLLDYNFKGAKYICNSDFQLNSV